MPPEDFANAFRIYWDAGYQVHIHVTGDAGVDMVLDNVEANMRRIRVTITGPCSCTSPCRKKTRSTE